MANIEIEEEKIIKQLMTVKSAINATSLITIYIPANTKL